MEAIRAAAIKCADGKVYEGRDHEQAYLLIKEPSSDIIMGFTTTKWRFVTRRVAEQIAYKAGQVTKKPDGLAGINSEEIWDQKGKRLLWSKEKGYYKDGEAKKI